MAVAWSAEVFFATSSSQVGRILFAAYTGTDLDYDCKRWRMFADVTNDAVRSLLDMVTLSPR